MNDLGNITVNNGGGIFYYRTLSQLSDDRLKHNEESVTNALDVINQLGPKSNSTRAEVDGGQRTEVVMWKITIMNWMMTVTQSQKTLM